jgi:hypothetical protein
VPRGRSLQHTSNRRLVQPQSYKLNKTAVRGNCQGEFRKIIGLKKANGHAWLRTVYQNVYILHFTEITL